MDFAMIVGLIAFTIQWIGIIIHDKLSDVRILEESAFIPLIVMITLIFSLFTVGLSLILPVWTMVTAPFLFFAIFASYQHFVNEVNVFKPLIRWIKK